MNASGRLNTCKSNGKALLAGYTSGGRVRNAYGTYPLLEDSPGKLGLILHNILERHLFNIKTPVVKDSRASH